MKKEAILTDDDITKALVTNGTFLSEGEVSRYDIDFARAIEQAVLQSPEVQAWKRDAERYRWLRDPYSGAERVVFYSRGDYGKDLDSGPTLDANIDAAMEKNA